MHGCCLNLLVYIAPWWPNHSRCLRCSCIQRAAAAAAAKSLQSCLTLRLKRQQATRLPRPWDSPGKNIGMGCHFPSPMHDSEKWKWSRSVVSDSSPPHGLQPTRLLCPWDFPGKSTWHIYDIWGFIHILFLVSQFSSVTQSCLTPATPWITARQASLSITNSQSSLKLIYLLWL